MAAQKTLHLLASKLGVRDNEKVVNKAAELERLLQNKTLARQMATDTAKVVICLDLAASLFSADLDTKLAIKYSGLKTPSYISCRKTIENLLELNAEILTIPSLCLMMNCGGVQSLAQTILEEYQKNSIMEIDLNLPQYVCMAVFQACRANKVKVSKSKLVERSRLKPGTWAKLEAEWAKLVETKVAAKKKGRAAKIANIEEDFDNQMEIDTEEKQDTDQEVQMEPYESWKRRMLETAYSELKELEAKEDRSAIRKSPRKTPVKYSPYKNGATQEKGVRLLFPSL